jgi:hypothetical protein
VALSSLEGLERDDPPPPGLLLLLLLLLLAGTEEARGPEQRYRNSSKLDSNLHLATN